MNDNVNDPDDGATTYGGIGRLSYFLSQIAMLGVFLLAGAFSGSDGLFLAGAVVLLVVAILLLYLRFKNQAASGWWVLGTIVPILNIYVAVRAYAYPEGYGVHRKLDGPAKVIAALVLLVFLGQCAAVAIPAYNEYIERAESLAQPESS